VPPQSPVQDKVKNENCTRTTEEKRMSQIFPTSSALGAVHLNAQFKDRNKHIYFVITLTHTPPVNTNKTIN
jgi:hypothetical protein